MTLKFLDMINSTKLKILWLTNTPCSASEKLKNAQNSGGWLSSLESKLSSNNNIELHVAFYHNSNVEPFNYNNTFFYPIFRKYKSKKYIRYFTSFFRIVKYDDIELKILTELIDGIKPDLIHIHGTENNFGLVQRNSNIPTVVSIQGLINPYFEKLFSGIPFSEIRKHENILQKIKSKTAKKFSVDFQEKANREIEILSLCKNIIGRTDWDRRIAQLLAPKARYYIGQEMLRPIFYNNIWTKHEFSQSVKIVTLTSNRLYKGYESIVKTAHLLKRYSKIKFEWLVIGLNPEDSIVKVVGNWLSLNYKELDIKLLNRMNASEIKKILLDSDIYCQVSHIENSPNSLCEAMILGLPIIATSVGGTGSLLHDGKEGILVQDGDSFALAGAIVELANNFNSAKAMGENATNRANERHAPSMIVEELLKIYKDCINKTLK